jgi:hypothetical protein
VHSTRSAGALISFDGMPALPNKSPSERPSIRRSSRSLSMLTRGSPPHAGTTSAHKIHERPKRVHTLLTLCKSLAEIATGHNIILAWPNNSPNSSPHWPIIKIIEYFVMIWIAPVFGCAIAPWVKGMKRPSIFKKNAYRAFRPTPKILAFSRDPYVSDHQNTSFCILKSQRIARQFRPSGEVGRRLGQIIRNGPLKQPAPFKIQQRLCHTNLALP